MSVSQFKIPTLSMETCFEIAAMIVATRPTLRPPERFAFSDRVTVTANSVERSNA